MRPLEMFHLKYRWIYSCYSNPLNTSMVFQVGRVPGHVFCVPSVASTVKSRKPRVLLLFY